MPELPEVETVRRSLNGQIVGKTIAAIGTDWAKIMNGGLALFQEQLIGQTFTAIDRRGKYLLMRLTGGRTIVSHLRMEGQYSLVETTDEPHARFTHVWFTFTDGTELRYYDSRKFGRMTLVPTGLEAEEVKGIGAMGPEPVTSDFLVPDFAARLKRHKKAIKSVILDQTVVAGVGNIYADETLWMSRIHPEQAASSLTLDQITTLHDAIIEELAASIAMRGTTVHSFVDAFGRTGGFQSQLQVYGKKGMPCPRCGTAIEKIKVGGRGTHFCPRCQVRTDLGTAS